MWVLGCAGGEAQPEVKNQERTVQKGNTKELSWELITEDYGSNTRRTNLKNVNFAGLDRGVLLVSQYLLYH